MQPIDPGGALPLFFLPLGMHIQDLPQVLRDKLAYGGITIKPRVWLTVTTLEAHLNGTYGPNYATYRFEVTNRLLEYPNISIERSRWPDDYEFTTRSIDCTLRFANTDQLFAVAQDGAILRATDIEQAIVDIYADVGGTTVNWFSGRVSGRPNETAGVTTFMVSGHLWEAIRKPVMYENFGTILGQMQEISGGNAGFFPNSVHIDCVGQHFCMHHGLVAFDSGGQPTHRFKKTGGDIELKALRLANGMKLGKYVIKFSSHAGYTITGPDNIPYSGNRFRGADPLSPIQIDPAYWSGNDGLGCEIEFFISWTAFGNGIAMAYHLLEKALKDNWGQLPGTVTAQLDVDAFRFWAQRFASFPIHVSETNLDNSVFDGNGKNRPLEYATFVQKMLSHYQCALTILPDGTISISGPYMDDRPSWPHDTAQAITGDGIELQGGDTINYITVNFGIDTNGGYAAPLIRDLNPNALQRVEKVFSLPYIKVGIGTRHALWWERMITRRFMRDQTLVKYSVEHGHGLLLSAGDRITVDSNILPLLTRRCEIIQVERGIGSEATVTAAIVQDGEGEAAIVQFAEIGTVGLW